MKDREIRPTDIAKGMRLEKIIFDALETMAKWLESNNIEAKHEYNRKNRGGRGNRGVDHIFTVHHLGYTFRCFVEDKNWTNRRQVTLGEAIRRIVNKLRYIGFLAGQEGRHYEMMYVVGHMNMSKSVLTTLAESEIFYLDLGELDKDDPQVLSNAQDLFIVEMILRITKVIDLSNTIKPLELEVIDKEKIVVKNGSQEQVFDLSKFPTNAFIFLNRYEPTNFIQIRRGQRGSIRILCPWKVRTGNAGLSVKNRRYDETFWEVQISEHRPLDRVETLVISTSKSSIQSANRT